MYVTTVLVFETHGEYKQKLIQYTTATTNSFESALERLKQILLNRHTYIPVKYALTDQDINALKRHQSKKWYKISVAKPGRNWYNFRKFYDYIILMGFASKIVDTSEPNEEDIELKKIK